MSRRCLINVGGDKMKFGIIGTGIVGTALAVQLERAGHQCVGVHTRSTLSYRRFRSYLNIEQLDLAALLKEADWLFITTQDASIRLVAEALTREQVAKSGQLWVHCSGSLSSQILRVDSNYPISCLSLHPLQAFADVDKALEYLPGTHFGIEGDNQDQGEQIVHDLGGIPHRLIPGSKSSYHAGAVVASNYLVVLASLAVELFAQAGIPQEEALRSLIPLMNGTLHNLDQLGLPRALTGPIARGDVEVVEKHLAEMPLRLGEVYQILGLRALDLAVAKQELTDQAYPDELRRKITGLLGPH